MYNDIFISESKYNAKNGAEILATSLNINTYITKIP